MKKDMTFEEKMARVKDFRPIDDVFFEVLARNRSVCTEILCTILEDRDLVVEDVVVQSSKRNIYGRSVRLDALCTLGNGTKCNIEVQRSDDDNHLKRARYNASCVTVVESKPGDKFNDILELYIVYISEFDIFKEGKTIYHVDKVLRESGTKVDDGLHTVFVNSSIDDGTDIADLMSCFIKKDVNNPRFPELSAETHRLKNTESGVSTMCETMEKYIDIGRAEGREEGLAEGRAEGREIGLAEGLAEGREAGLAEGRIEQLKSLVKANIINVEIAAEQAGMPVTDFESLMK